MGKEVTIQNIDMYGSKVIAGQPGAAYQVASGDESNETFVDTIKNGGEKFRKDHPEAARDLEDTARANLGHRGVVITG